MISRLRHDEQGSLTPAYLLVLVSMAAGTLLFMQVGNATVLAADANNAADAAVLAGARELRDQFVGRDVLPVGVGVKGAVCDAAADYAARNDAELTACDVDIPERTVTVSVRGTVGTIDGPLDVQDARPVMRARARIDLPVAPPGGGWGAGGSSSFKRPDLRADLRGAQPPELIQEMATEAQRIHDLRLPYVWGGGHQSSPTPPNGPFDCSGAVSHALQTLFPDFPTMVSGQMTNIGAPGASPSGRGVTIYAYDGHVFMVIGGKGWGTGNNGWSDGAGWLPYNTPYHGKFQARHIPLLEPHGAQVDEVAEMMGGVGIGPGGGSPIRASTPIRLVAID